MPGVLFSAAGPGLDSTQHEAHRDPEEDSEEELVNSIEETQVVEVVAEGEEGAHSAANDAREETVTLPPAPDFLSRCAPPLRSRMRC